MSQRIRLQRALAERGDRTKYAVLLEGEVVGFVRSYRVLRYRGSQGWNRGIRLHDFHPVRWGWRRFAAREWVKTYYSRARAVEALLADLARLPGDATGGER